MECYVCGGPCQRHGRNRNGTQRYYCRRCLLSYSETREQASRVFADKRLTMDKAVGAIRLLMEGTSVRSACRLLRLGQHTLLDLLRLVGDGCARLQRELIVDVPCRSIQCDELWSWVYCKERTRLLKGYHHPELGDCYTWTAIEKSTKLILAYAVGKRDNATAMDFARKLRRATTGHFQLDTDGLGIYRSVIPLVFGRYQDHAQVIKIFGQPAEGEARYSPPQIIDLHVQVGSGWPDLEAASTSFVERANLTIRMMLRRFTRLTNAASKSWPHHEAALGLLFGYYNLVRKHMTLGTTPAVAAGVADHVWTAEELIRRAVDLPEATVA